MRGISLVGLYTAVKELVAVATDTSSLSLKAGAFTPLQAAREKGWEQIVELLESYVV